MQKIKIGVWDKEQNYVVKLSSYLQKYGKGVWDVVAFTEKGVLEGYLKKRELNILVGTEKRSLLAYVENSEMTGICLGNEREDIKREGELYIIYRFQGAGEIAKQIEMVVRRIQREGQPDKFMIAVYSPVGRCGKTSLALRLVKNEGYGNWLYMGMEDYSSFSKLPEGKEKITDEIMYYWKERKEEKILLQLEQVEKTLVSGTSLFDSRQIGAEDIRWFRNVFQKSEFRGVIFDIGSGVLQNLQAFREFDAILIPYLEEETAQIKKDNFKDLLVLQGWKDCGERLHFLNMDRPDEVEKQLQKVMGE